MSKFVLKWLINGAIVASALVYYSDLSFWGAAIAATGLTIIAYLLGDQLILRATNNIFAAIADFILAAVYLGALSYAFDWRLNLGATLFIAFLVGVAEWLLHYYVFNEQAKIGTSKT